MEGMSSRAGDRKKQRKPSIEIVHRGKTAFLPSGTVHSKLALSS